MANMNRITNSLILLIMISMILPTSVIMYASGQSTDNSDDSSAGGSTTDNSDSSSSGGGSSTTTDNSGSSSSGRSTDSGGSSTGGGTTTTTDNSGSSTGGGSTDNSATLPTTSTTSDNTGNAQQQSNSTNSTKIPPYCKTCDDDIYKGTGDFASMILAGHNRERAALGVAPLAWNNEMAARAQDWVNYNLAHGTFTHCVFVKGWEQIESCTHHEGENGAASSCVPHPTTGTCNVPAQMQEGWFAENPTDHWLQVVSKTATSIGCAYGTGPNPDDPNNPAKIRDLMYCRYSPPGLDVPGMICGGTCTEIKSP
jgi:uncharacterized protein YkwD